MGTITCIGGIDTDIGKTVATGMLARTLLEDGQSVITQKIAQTGCTGISEDIVAHRELMGVELLPEDLDGRTCSSVFARPCSPHLAAELAGTEIDTAQITKNSNELAAKYDHVLLEGVGGLLVPLKRNFTFLDYVQQQKYPLILVSSSRLGSINHTLSALEITHNRGILVKGIIYNCFEKTDPEIVKDSKIVFKEALEDKGYPGKVITLDSVEKYTDRSRDFNCLNLFK